MTGYIYCHISPSGKKYIGQTTTNLEHRFNNGKNYISSPVFWKAIEKYGWNNFQHIILHTVDKGDKEELIEELNALEREEIISQNTIVPNGYNIELGGGQGRVTKERAMQISQTELGRPSPTKDQLIEFYVKRNLTIEQTGDALGFNRDIISKYLKWYEIPINYKHRTTGKIDFDLVEDFYINKNYTLEQISKELGLPIWTLTDAIKEHNLYKRKGKELSYDKLKELYVDKNYTANLCAKILNTSYSKVRRYITKYNLQKGGRGSDKI